MKEWYAVVAGFLGEAQVELKKVTWPTRQQTVGSTVVVLVTVVFTTLLLGLADALLGRLLRGVL